VAPGVEGLEGRQLLYATLGAQWVYPIRVTYSFVPDGTSIGGVPSSLFQTLNSKFSTAVWEQQFQKAAAVWESVANINLVQVDDDGSPLGAYGNPQGDPRFGDIRFSAIPQPNGTLASCVLPPPLNPGTEAGDIVLNSSMSWQINSTYDLETVAIHEIGHALGMGHSQITYACMFANYNGIKQSLTSDDISGIQSIYGAPQPDRFNSNGSSNGIFTKATNLNPYITPAAQVSVSGLEISSFGQTEWFYVTVPATTNGTMTATMQSSDLSSLSPSITVFTSGLRGVGQASSASFGDTVSVTTNVQAGQSYYIRINANMAGATIGAFGLQLNFGSLPQPPISPPNTTVSPRTSGGSLGTNLSSMLSQLGNILLGNRWGWGETLTVGGAPPIGLPVGPPVVIRPPVGGPISVLDTGPPAFVPGGPAGTPNAAAGANSLVTFLSTVGSDLPAGAYQALDTVLDDLASGVLSGLLDHSSSKLKSLLS
jgi:hypothetical protein